MFEVYRARIEYVRPGTSIQVQIAHGGFLSQCSSIALTLADWTLTV